MNLEEAIRTCLGKYIEVRGRASRHEFWWFVLFLVAGSTAAALADAQLTRMALPDDPVPMLRRDGIPLPACDLANARTNNGLCRHDFVHPLVSSV